MRILFTGGGTGGHFYPIISVAEELNNLLKEHKIVGAELYFMSPSPYNPGLLFENGITYKRNSAGKLRRNLTPLNLVRNFFDMFKVLWGVVISLIQIYRLYPDVVFGKGAYASFPALLAARILRIPVVIHESDTVPGRVNLWAGKFAQRIAISYEAAAKYFPPERTAHTGNPIRHELATPVTRGAREFLKIEEDIPVILILGGSQGAEVINDTILAGLKQLVEKYAVIHQTGKEKYQEVRKMSEAILFDSPHKGRYKTFDYLNTLAMRMSAGVASVVISRAGSSIFEIAAWGVPSIIVPIGERVSRDQKKNAFAYARSGACVVVEEANLSPNIILSEISRILGDKEESEKMRTAAKNFFKPNASRLVAEEILKIALTHEIEK